MYGILLMLSGTLFHEVSNSLGKQKVKEKQETIFVMGFLNTFFVTVLFLLLAVLRPSLFVFSLASLPTVALRIVLEIAQAHFTILAIVKADRTTFSFLRILTLPLLLIVDLVLGYSIGVPQFIGIGIILAVLVVLFINHGVSKKGGGVVLFTAFNAVVTISLYKYHLSNFNSVVAEQSIMMVAIFLYFVCMTLCVSKKNPFRFLRKRIFFIQSASSGIGSVFDSFAFAFAPASVIMAAKRSSVVLWSMLSGATYFREQHMIKKVLAFFVLVFAIVLLAINGV